MNLFERFWRTVEEFRELANNGTEPMQEISITPVHPPEGVQNEASRDLTSIVRRAPRRFPPCVFNQPRHSARPFCLVYSVARNDYLPQFHELFENYVDKNAFVAETFLRLRPHCEIPYVLFLGEKCFLLYDAVLEELLRWGTDYTALDEAILQPMALGQDMAHLWGHIPRKNNSQRAEEFGRWLDLWKVGIGARTSATPAFMQTIMQKAVLLYLYDLHFGLQDPELRLRTNFLEQRPAIKRLPAADSPHVPFDGIAWLHEASAEFCRKYHLQFLRWTQAESNFFALMGAETRLQFSQFILELFLLSQAKFTAPVQTDVFSDANSRLKLWKFSVTETLNIRRRLHADEVNVYEPVWIDLEESGIGWALLVIKQTLEFWRDRCIYFEQQLSERKQLKLQFDMFQQPNLDKARVPNLSDVFETAFATSLRVYYTYADERDTLEYLITLTVFDFCKQWGTGLRSLHKLADIFHEKEQLAAVHEL